MRQVQEEIRPLYPEELDFEGEEIENAMDNEPMQFEPGDEGDEPIGGNTEAVSDEEFESMMDCENQLNPEIDETDSLPEIEEAFEPEKDSSKKAKESDRPKTAEEASQNFEEHLRLTCPNWNERQIIIALDDHRVKNLGLPPLAEANLTQEIREWISRLDGEFYTREVFDELGIPTNKKSTISTILSRLIDERIIERAGRKRGCFRRVETELDLIDIFNCDEKTVSIQLPLGIHQFAEIMPGNIIIVAGEPNVGKTAFLLNIAASNMYDFDVSYFSSEMGDRELRKRLKLFEDVPFEDWRKFKPYVRSENFADVIKPGEGNLNLIDFLEIHDEFYLVGKLIHEIYRKLDGAVAVIALQKNPGTPYPLGGIRSLEKARVAISLERHNKANVAVIRKVKNWKGKDNPNGKQLYFKLVQGHKFIASDVWTLPE